MEIKNIEGQTEWGWKIAAYLFLAGVGAGGYAAGVIADFLHWEFIARAGIIIGFPLVFIGTFFLIADLGVKMRALRAFMNPGTSWIAKGTWIISIFMVLGFIHIVTWFWPFQWLEAMRGLRLALSALNLIFALLTMIYTGVLLGASRPIPIWSTAVLPLLFLVSAVSTGVMAILLLLSCYGIGTGSEVEASLARLAKLDILLIILEFIVIASYLQATHRTVESRAAALLIIRGKLSGYFWGGVISVGLLLPILIEIIDVLFFKRAPLEATIILIFASTIPGLIGGLLLRFVVLAAGVKAPLRAAGIEYTIPRVTL
ncbi:MAG: NrfD/PsrC family molybdoenzyme membrane anchor subunit [Acidobacteriota bacterium]